MFVGKRAVVRVIKLLILCLVFVIVSRNRALAQMEMDHHEHEETSAASEFLMNEAAGTAVNPSSSAPHMYMKKRGQWTLMAHGFAFLNAINQSGPRGADRVFSTNHAMLMAERPVSHRSSLLLRAMMSLEPATITRRYYPELFQTGESAFGKAIVDGQHPHDFIMELSVQYAVQLNQHTLIHFYAAPVGDPALGPVAYPHRISAEELPLAPLGHHWEDSSHIANEVLTAGISYRKIRWEASAFHGAEPDEHRWNIDTGAIDSWSTRVTLIPSKNWAAQLSTGRLKKPEELEAGDVQRTTGSISYNRKVTNGLWASTFLFGHNHKFAAHQNTNVFGFETVYQFQHRNYLTGRAESVDKDELFANDPDIREHFESIGQPAFRIEAFTVGYARDLNFIPGWATGIGANLILYSFPSQLNTFYGTSPKTFLIYVRIRPGHSM